MSSNFFSDYLERMAALRRNLHQAVEGLPDAAIDWVPGPEMNSLAVILTHTTGALRYWVGDVALQDPSGRVRAEEFKVQGISGKTLLNRLDAVFDYVQDNLPRLRLEDLEQARAAGDEKVTVGWALLHALDHTALHLGHVQLTSQLWREKSPTRL